MMLADYTAEPVMAGQRSKLESESNTSVKSMICYVKATGFSKEDTGFIISRQSSENNKCFESILWDVMVSYLYQGRAPFIGARMYANYS